MRARTFTPTLLLIVLALCTTLAYSQTPQGFSYQAVVRDGSGTPITNQAVSLQVTLQSFSGDIYYTEHKTITTSPQGVVSYSVGTGTPTLGTFASIPWQLEDIYIKVAIDPAGGSNYTELGDPAKLQPVPYAFYALSGQQGPAGTDGTSIQWLGSFDTEPASPMLNQAYYNATEKKAYVFNGATWDIIAQDGAQGSPGTGLTNKGTWVSETPYASGDYVFHQSSTSLTENSMWICQLAVTSATPPYLDSDHWAEFTAPAGPMGPVGPPGPLVSGVLGQTLYHDGTTWAANSTLFNDNANSRIGINTTSPTSTLHVNGSLRVDGSLFDNSNSSGSTGNVLTQTAGGVLWQAPTGSITGTGTAGNMALWSGTSSLSSLPNLTFSNSLSVTGIPTVNPDDPIFEVKNSEGQVIFGVYQEGVRINIKDDIITKGARGGFAIGGLTNQSKEQQEYFRITPDSARLYVKEVPTTKGARGGFAIGGLTNQSKTVVTRNMMFIAPDSARIYIDDAVTTKGARGGFAIGGLTNQSKGGSANFFNVSTSSTENIYPSEKRVMWYPLKNAFLAGQVLIELPDSVGVNSFATGFESKAKGNFSQALGYQSIARGLYSTAIGYQAVAHKNNSFAFGYQARAATDDSYAFGSGAQATGSKSFAFGSVGIDSTTIVATGTTTGHTIASGDYAFAFGLGSLASGTGSVAFGANNTSSGNFSTAIGYYTTSSGTWYSTSIGAHTTASANYSVAMGYKTTASGAGASAFGAGSLASGAYSFASGYLVKAQAAYSTALGYQTTASGIDAVAIGVSSTASGFASTAMGSGTTAGGNYSTASGFQSSTASGALYSFAGGFKSSASGSNSAIALGYQASASGNYSTAIGRNVIASNQDAIAMGSSTTASGANSTAFGSQTTASGSYSFVNGYGCIANIDRSTVIGQYNLTEGTNATYWTLTDPLFVIGNGTAAGAEKNALVVYKSGNMKLRGNLYPDADNTYDFGTSLIKWRYIYSNNVLQTSDLRLKDKVEDIAYGIADILKLKPVSFFWKNNKEVRNLGFIAQDVKPVIGEAVVEGNDPEKTLSMSYTSIIPVMVKGMQEQQQQIDKQQQQIEELIAANKALLDRLNKLEESNMNKK